MSNSHIGKLNPKFCGYYITPWGKFESANLAETDIVKQPSIVKFCKYNDCVISKTSISLSKYLQSLSESPLGKTYNDIGFDFIPV